MGLNELQISLNTRLAYENDYKTYLRLIGIDLVNTNCKNVMEYINKLHSENYAPNSISRKIGSLSKQLSILVLDKVRLDNPVKDLMVLNRNLVPKTIRRIKQTLVLNDVDCIKGLKNNRTALLIELLYSTGCRISEALSIKKRDIIDGMVKVLGKGNKARILFIATDLVERITTVFNSKSEYLIHTRTGNKADRINESKKIKALVKKTTGKDAHPHQLRHLYATTQIIDRKQSVKAVSKYLGHSSTATTLDMYVDDELSREKAIL